ncbi:hypothetical protein BOTBODRAFT_183617 [Botryobasidium botryosum FD-172 SS1]|uniref:Zn(2)-C6 fungal-type domain-containing protein n=1 Tax=Botryobasidium botryosum (strain FD-172 SS1) TaxID=930990 RepID=A0A067NAY2_BOTB1|nr:hypothetical protein BOTBODRAFT_183617 [Botryobasidium botryosum FD-172 SS1]
MMYCSVAQRQLRGPSESRAQTSLTSRPRRTPLLTGFPLSRLSRRQAAAVPIHPPRLLIPAMPSQVAERGRGVALGRNRACIPCREKKRRCDGLRPICTLCTKVRKPYLCAYSDCPEIQALNGRIEELNGLIQSMEQLGAFHQDNSISALLSSPRLGVAGLPNLCRASAAGCIVPAPLRDPQLDWWTSQEDALPDSIRDTLLSNFFLYAWQFICNLNPRRLRTTLELPRDHPDAPHPALFNAALLVGCIYSPVTLRRYESVFLRRTHQHLGQSLAHGQKLFDFLFASSLTGSYHFTRGRFREGHYYISAALRFALGCGLHKIESLDLDAQAPSRLLPPCADLVELGDRINLFWSLMCIDRTSSSVMGLPVTIPIREASTLWPCPPAYYEDGRALREPGGSVEHLDDLVALSRARDDNVLTIFQKSYLLLFRTSILSARAKLGDQKDSNLTQEALRMCQVTAIFAKSLPEFGVPEGHGEDPLAARSILVMAYTAAYSAVIKACGIIPQNNPIILKEQVQAAKKAMAIAREVEDMPDYLIPASVAWCLTPTHEFLVREKVRLSKLGRTQEAQATQADIQLFLRVVKKLEAVFPAALTVAAEVIDRNVEAVCTEAASTPVGELLKLG